MSMMGLQSGLDAVSFLIVAVSSSEVAMDVESSSPDANVRDDSIEVRISERESDEGDSEEGDEGREEGERGGGSGPVPDPPAPEGPAEQANDPAPSPAPPQVHYCYLDEEDQLDEFCAQFSNTFCDGVGTIQQDWEPEEDAVIGNAECGDDEPAQPVAPQETAEEDDDAPPPPVITQEDLAQLPIEAGSVSFEPDLLGFGYINRHTNVFAQTEAQTISREMLGYEVDVRATPAEFHWDYGDGSTRTTYDPGGPFADGDAAGRTDAETITSHVYVETGRFDVRLNTTFIGEYRIDGGPWTAIYGSTTIASSPGQADIWQLSSRNVDTTCARPGPWGCNGPVELEPGQSPPAVFEDQYDAEGRWVGS